MSEKQPEEKMDKVSDFYEGDDQWYEIDDGYIDSIKKEDDD